MSYRSFKRVLGETSLERKCRFLFGACLLLLITGSFWLYGTKTEELVNEKNHSTGQLLVDAATQKYHVWLWETDPLRRPMVADMSEDFENLKYEWEFIYLEPTKETSSVTSKENPNVRGPDRLDDWERKELYALKDEYERFVAELASKASSKTDSGGLGAVASPSPANSSAAAPENVVPLVGPDIPFLYRPVYSEGEYRYYQPVVFWGKKNCNIVGCHPTDRELARWPNYAGKRIEDFPMRVVKVVIPYEETRKAINRNRAMLLATAIITVFLAMIALYVVVRYVIVKPLKHLRDVSDEIARGNYSLSADIHTRDEFEDLAQSFNRMLRHLVEAGEELRSVNANLDARVDELAQANMRLYEMNRLKSDFLANMSHELRTPLNSIIGFSDVLQGIDSLNEKQQRYVRNIGQSGRVLLDMINDILDLAKMESGKMDVSPTDFSIDAVVHAQCNMVRSLTEEKNIDLEVLCAPGLPPLHQDQSKVQQILTNLLSNAIKFTPEGGRITVSVQLSSDDEVTLCVTDTGVGIAEEDQEIIFEKFRQGTALKEGDDLTREFTGTGLGLSIVKELCKLLGGEITFESELGKGSSFTVRLPCVLVQQPRRDSEIATRIDEITLPRRSSLLAKTHASGNNDDPQRAAASPGAADPTPGERTTPVSASGK